MTTLENHQIKGITLKSIFATLFSTVSIVASVMAAYYGLKADIQQIRADRVTETRLTNLRLTVLENEVALLQKEINGIKLPAENSRLLISDTAKRNQRLLTVAK